MQRMVSLEPRSGTVPEPAEAPRTAGGPMSRTHERGNAPLLAPRLRRPPRRQARSSPASALRSLDLQGYLRETAVPLPEGLGNAVTPDMEYLIDRRLVLEEGRFAAKALRGGSRSEGARAPASPRDSMTMFMATLGTNPLLTREHEGRLMAMVSRWHELQRKARELQAALGREPTRAEWAAAAGLGPLELAQQEWCGQEARMLMAQYNMRLVLHIAKRYVNRGVELPDLVAEGMEGLLRAVDKFDHRRGVKFSTYSHWWVRQAITRAITNQSRVVRLPVHVWDLAHKILRVEQEITVRRCARAARPGGRRTRKPRPDPPCSPAAGGPGPRGAPVARGGGGGDGPARGARVASPQAGARAQVAGRPRLHGEPD